MTEGSKSRENAQETFERTTQDLLLAEAGTKFSDVSPTLLAEPQIESSTENTVQVKSIIATLKRIVASPACLVAFGLFSFLLFLGIVRQIRETPTGW